VSAADLAHAAVNVLAKMGLLSSNGVLSISAKQIPELPPQEIALLLVQVCIFQ
jgi:hypothetical protein